MAIELGNVVFTEPVALSCWSARNVAGVFAVLAPDPEGRPQPFRVLYFGASGNLAAPGLICTHPAYPSWIKQAGSVFRLHLSVYAMPLSTLAERSAVEASLVQRYKPPCNEAAPLVPPEVLIGARSSSASNYSLFTVSPAVPRRTQPYVSSLSRARDSADSLPFPAEKRSPKDQ